MKYTWLIILFNFYTPTLVGQTLDLIDKKLNGCLLDSAGEGRRQYCCREATKEYDELIVKIEGLLNQNLSTGQIKFLNEEQKSWKDYRKKELEFYSLVANQTKEKGLMTGSIVEAKELEIVKEKAKELDAFAKILTTRK